MKDILFTLLFFTPTALMADRLSISAGDFIPGPESSSVETSLDISVRQTKKYRLGVLAGVNGEVCNIGISCSGSIDSVMAGVSIENDTSRLFVSAGAEGFFVEHVSTGILSDRKKIFFGVGVSSSREGKELPISVYADIGSSRSFFDIVISTKYRIRKTIDMSSDGSSFMGGYDAEPWITISYDFNL